jgi:glycosyltransferase involved in cell wall biosynthesis
MIRIGFFGPLPPSRTGIADYNQALLPLLRKEYEVDVFLPTGEQLTSQSHSHAEFHIRDRKRPYDLLLYQIGNNSRFHEYMYGYLFQNPGAVVFHDSCLHHSRAQMLLQRSMTNEYREELRYVYGDRADRIANAVISSAAGDLLFFEFPMFDLILRSSLAAAAHTDFSVQILSGSDTPVIKIPQMLVPLTEQGQNDDLIPGKKIVASFGFATAAKRSSTILEAIAELRKEDPDYIYVIVGEVEDRAALQSQMESCQSSSFPRGSAGPM